MTAARDPVDPRRESVLVVGHRADGSVYCSWCGVIEDRVPLRDRAPMAAHFRYHGYDISEEDDG